MKISNEAVTTLVTNTWADSSFVSIKLVQVFAFRRISSEWFRASNVSTFLHDLSSFDYIVLIHFVFISYRNRKQKYFLRRGTGFRESCSYIDV